MANWTIAERILKEGDDYVPRCTICGEEMHQVEKSGRYQCFCPASKDRKISGKKANARIAKS